MPAVLVSVVVPVYNVADYLEECFHSICRQTYQNIEIILVDDGSTDDSGQLCDELALRDSRARVIHKCNGGLSDARNIGLMHSRGEWVSFVDSDDYISPVFVEALLCAASESNCLIAGVPFGKQFDDNKVCSLIDDLDLLPAPKVLPSREIQRLMLYQVLDTGAPWRLYNRKLLGSNPFPVGLYYEDLASVYKIIESVSAVAVIDCNELYAYRIRQDSIIGQKYSHKKGFSAIEIANKLYSDICKWYPDLSAAASSRCFSLCRMVFAQLPSSARYQVGEFASDWDSLWEILSRHRKAVLLDSYARKRERLSAFIALFGSRVFWSYCWVCRKLGLMR